MRVATVLTSIWFLSVPGAVGQEAPAHGALEARVWLEGGGDEPVVQRGDRVEARFRTTEDAFTAIFRIDTDGRIVLLFPREPADDGYVRGGRDHRLTFERSPFWRVTDDPGLGYLFMVSSPEPLDFSAFDFDPLRGWDLSPVSAVVYEDPYVAIDEYVAALIPDWEVVPYALDFVTYHVGETRSYPRFLCYDCHGFRSYPSWNPYASTCSTYQVVVYDDPYFYPTYRYSGTRVVYPRPIHDRPRYALAVRGGSDTWAPIVRVRAAPPRPTEFKEPAAARRTPASLPVRRDASPASGDAERPPSARISPMPRSVAPRSDRTTPAAVAPRGAPSDRVQERPVLRRRPSSGTGGVAPAPGARPAVPRGGSRPDSGTARPTAPATRPSGPDRPMSPATRPSGSERQPTRPAAGSRPAVSPPASRPAPSARPRGGARPSGPDPSRPAAGSRPSSARPGPSRPAAGSRPSPRAAPTRPGSGSPSAAARPGASRSSGESRPAAAPPGSSRPRTRPGGA